MEGKKKAAAAVLIYSLAITAAAAAGQPATAEGLPEPESAEHGTISGTVVDRVGGPVNGALVVVEGTNRFATTNVNGYYVISPVPVGTFDVTAGRVGHETETMSVSVMEGRRTIANFALGAGPPSVEMGTEGLVEGVVVDAAGCPLSGVHVCILDGDESTRTDKNGAFAVGPLAPGFYCLRARCPGYLFQTGRLLVVGGETTRVQFVLWADPRRAAFDL